MLKKITLILLLTVSLWANELLVIAHKDFPKNDLSKEVIKAIFLDKKRFINSKRILAMNHKARTPLRLCFEKNILEKSERTLRRYWRRAFYKGKRPPKVISSTLMLNLYLKSVQPSIGYVDGNTTLNKNVKILYRINCL